MGSLPLLFHRLVDTAGKLELAGEPPQTIELFVEDTAESLEQNVQHAFDIVDGSRVTMYYEQLKNDPDDPTVYKLISTRTVVSKAQKFLETNDVGVLMVPLENGKLELFIRAQQLQAAAAVAAAGGLGQLPLGSLTPAVTPGSAAASGGGGPGSSVGALVGRRSSSSTGAANRALTLMKSRLRRQQAGVRVPADAGPSPVGRGKGKSRQQPYCKDLYKLIPVSIPRASNGLYYQAGDKVPDNPGFNNVKEVAFLYVQKKVLTKHDVPEQLVRNGLNTRLSRLNGELATIQNCTEAQVLDDKVLTKEEQRETVLQSAAQTLAQGSAAEDDAPGSKPANQGVSEAAANLLRRLNAAGAAGSGAQAASAGRGNARGAAAANGGRGGNRGSGSSGQATAAAGSRGMSDSDDTADESSDEDDYTSSEEEEEEEEGDAAAALDDGEIASSAAAAAAPSRQQHKRGRQQQQQQQQKKKKLKKAGSRHQRVVAPSTLPVQPGAERTSSRRPKPNSKYQ